MSRLYFYFRLFNFFSDSAGARSQSFTLARQVFYHGNMSKSTELTVLDNANTAASGNLYRGLVGHTTHGECTRWDRENRCS